MKIVRSKEKILQRQQRKEKKGEREMKIIKIVNFLPYSLSFLLFTAHFYFPRTPRKGTFHSFFLLLFVGTRLPSEKKRKKNVQELYIYKRKGVEKKVTLMAKIKKGT